MSAIKPNENKAPGDKRFHVIKRGPCWYAEVHRGAHDGEWDERVHAVFGVYGQVGCIYRDAPYRYGGNAVLPFATKKTAEGVVAALNAALDAWVGRRDKLPHKGR